MAYNEFAFVFHRVICKCKTEDGPWTEFIIILISVVFVLWLIQSSLDLKDTETLLILKYNYYIPPGLRSQKINNLLVTKNGYTWSKTFMIDLRNTILTFYVKVLNLTNTKLNLHFIKLMTLLNKVFFMILNETLFILLDSISHLFPTFLSLVNFFNRNTSPILNYLIDFS